MIDKHIARTLLCAPSQRKWTNYQTHFHDFFANRWPLFDQLVSFIGDFFAQFDAFPTIQGYENELTAANDQPLLEYVRTTANDTTMPICPEEADFASALRASKIQCLRSDLLAPMQEFETTIKKSPAHQEAVLQELNRLLSKLYTHQQRALGSDAAALTVLYGPQAGLELRDHYEAIKAQRAKGDPDIILPFPKLADVRIKPGDLVFVGAYTSQGKSMLLRALAYHLFTTYGLNVGFWSLEMSRDAVRTMFTLLHANNKRIFPNTPYIPVGAYRDGQLTDEQGDFLFNVSNKDLIENPNYGVPSIEQPNKPGFSIADLTQRLAVIQQTRMPIHVLVIDYITYMNPVPTSAVASMRRPDYSSGSVPFAGTPCVTRTPSSS